LRSSADELRSSNSARAIRGVHAALWATALADTAETDFSSVLMCAGLVAGNTGEGDVGYAESYVIIFQIK
jgi:hypothetical protein